MCDSALGRELKRLLGHEPVRFRRDAAETRFLLIDCSDADAGALVRDRRCLQLSGGSDTSPLVLDIDSLHPTGATTVTAAAFAFICTKRELSQ